MERISFILRKKVLGCISSKQRLHQSSYTDPGPVGKVFAHLHDIFIDISAKFTRRSAPRLKTSNNISHRHTDQSWSVFQIMWEWGNIWRFMGASLMNHCNKEWWWKKRKARWFIKLKKLLCFFVAILWLVRAKNQWILWFILLSIIILCGFESGWKIFLLKENVNSKWYRRQFLYNVWIESSEMLLYISHNL